MDVTLPEIAGDIEELQELARSYPCLVMENAAKMQQLSKFRGFTTLLTIAWLKQKEDVHALGTAIPERDLLQEQIVANRGDLGRTNAIIKAIIEQL